MKASDLFVKALENEGITHIFGVPGEENLDLVNALQESPIQLVLTRHEQAAGFMAATVGRLTGKVGVCLSTLGPGATNLMTAAAYAQLGGMPMLMISGQKPIKESKQGQFQILNVVDMMQPVTKWTHQVVSGSQIPAMVREAVRVAQEERPGATHLELPEDIAQEKADVDLVLPNEPRRPSADAKAIEDAVAMLMAAKQPLVLVGAGANRTRTHKALADFIQRTEIPFFTTQMGKGVLDERSPYCLGTAALSDNDYLHCVIDKADVILNMGHDVIEKPPFFMNEVQAKVIHLNFVSARVDQVYFPQLEVIGDIANSVCQLTERLEKQAHWECEYAKKIKQNLEYHLKEKTQDSRFPVIPQRLVADVRAAMPDDGIIALDNGMYKIWFARNYKAYQPNTVLLDNALASMGAGLPSAMGAKLVNPDKKVLAICGDGGFMMNSQELETAVRLKLDLVVLIVHDAALGMIKWKQEAMGFADYGLDFDNPDFVKYAEAYGAKGWRITETSELAPTLEKCLNSSGVHLIDVPIDYSENHRVLTQELGSKKCMIE